MIITTDVQNILDIFKENGFKAFLVGGCVRDSLLNRDISDYDITTNALPEETMKLFPRHIPTGLQHGTITVIVNNEQYEITTFRTESNYVDNRKPEKVEFVRDIKEDLSRRDFTINALAFNPDTGLIDYFDGINDLNSRVIKCVGDPYTRFNEDALRMLRAVRFSCKLNFKIEEKTLESIKLNSYLINNISNERIHDELCKILVTDYAVRGIKLLKETELLKYILPELWDLVGKTPRCTNHNRDIFNHTMCVLNQTPPILLVRLSALLHDIGKSKLIIGDNPQFINHAEYSYELSKSILKRLKFDNNTISIVSTLVRYHMDVYNNPSKLQVKSLIRNIGIENMTLLFDLQKADTLGIGTKCDIFLPRVTDAEKLYNEIIKNKEPLFIKDLAITGNDLINELGTSKGKKVGELLNEALNIVLENPTLNTKEYLLNKTLYKIE